jgi:aminoglycoside phosphotransferase (APT) family kinase protein
VSTAEAIRKLAEGREAELYTWDSSSVLRLLRDPNAHASNERQRVAMMAAATAGARVPAVREAVIHNGRPGLVMERIDGPDLLTLVGKQPWRVLWVAGHTGRAHAALHRAAAPASLPSVRDVIRYRVERSDRVPEHLREAALDVLERLPEGDRLLHGDLHPGNLMLAGDIPTVIDWTNASRGHPDADLARTILLLRLGDPPPGSSLGLRLLALVGRRLLLSGYRRAYARTRRASRPRLAQWQFVQAAERLDDNIGTERPKLLRLMERHV